MGRSRKRATRFNLAEPRCESNETRATKEGARGAAFARSLVSSGLIDEYQLVVHRVALGHGLPLFSELAAPLPLSLMSTTRFAGGAVA